MVVVELKKLHFVFTVGTFQWIIAKRNEDGSTPLVKTAKNMVFFSGNRTMEAFVNRTMTGINTAVPDHFKMLFRDMPDQAFYEIHGRECFFDIFFVFVAMVVEGDKFSIVLINAGCGYHGSTEIAADVLYHSFRIAFVGFCIDIKSMLVFRVTSSFDLLKRGTKFAFHFIKQSSAKSISKICVIKVGNMAPETIVTVSTF